MFFSFYNLSFDVHDYGICLLLWIIILYIGLIGGLLGTVLFFYLLEVTIVEALKKFKKWEKTEEEKNSK